MTTTTTRRVVTIPAACPTHANTPGLAHLTVVFDRHRVELDPHAHGRCALALDRAGAIALAQALAVWLR